MGIETSSKNTVVSFKEYRNPSLKRMSVEELYRYAARRRLFVTEDEGPRGFIASVGDRRPLDERGITSDSLGLLDLMSMSVPGSGTTREAAIRKALKAYDQYTAHQTTETIAPVRRLSRGEKQR